MMVKIAKFTVLVSLILISGTSFLLAQTQNRVANKNGLPQKNDINNTSKEAEKQNNVNAQGTQSQNPTKAQGTPNSNTPPTQDNEKRESTPQTEDIFYDDVVLKRLIVENKPMDLQPVREADVVWERRIQRIIDTREKQNLVFKSIESNLFGVIKNGIEKGEITAFADENFKTILSPDEVLGRMITFDTTTTTNEDYIDEVKVARNEIDWEKVNQYRIKEVWFFDKQRSVMDVRILGIAPIYQSLKDKEQGIPAAPLFWIYYPEARLPMSKVQVFNEDNDVAPMSWADLMDARNFSSYIYKRSNPLGYRLKDYFVPDPNNPDDQSGVDVLMMSDKIKNELLNFELDLWDY